MGLSCPVFFKLFSDVLLLALGISHALSIAHLALAAQAKHKVAPFNKLVMLSLMVLSNEPFFHALYKKPNQF